MTYVTNQPCSQSANGSSFHSTPCGSAAQGHSALAKQEENSLTNSSLSQLFLKVNEPSGPNTRGNPVSEIHVPMTQKHTLKMTSTHMIPVWHREQIVNNRADSTLDMKYNKNYIFITVRLKKYPLCPEICLCWRTLAIELGAFLWLGPQHAVLLVLSRFLFRVLRCINSARRVCHV